MRRMTGRASQADHTPSRILAATDGSERAMEAVRQAARLAASVGADLLLVHVLDTGRTVDVGVDVEGDAERTLDAGSAIARSLDVVPDARVLSGDPSVALIEFAETNGVDLVCVGPDAGVLGGAIRIGRVAIHILRESRCSVLVARHAEPNFPSRIGCAVDGSEASVETALAAAALAAAAGAELRLLHVVPVFRGHNAEWTLGPDEASPPEMEPSVTAAMSLGVNPIREMAMGRPERALVAAAEREELDLMVVGHRGIRGVRRVLGSVSEHVSHHAPCSVMVVRDADVAG
jgi:nucleotide-binding universal stress UspA family protein